jgi:hypothetical protein
MNSKSTAWMFHCGRVRAMRGVWRVEGGFRGEVVAQSCGEVHDDTTTACNPCMVGRDMVVGRSQSLRSLYSLSMDTPGAGFGGI